MKRQAVSATSVSIAYNDTQILRQIQGDTMSLIADNITANGKNEVLRL
jgi:hypothetical protein